jgi:anti-anti-sigma factor
MVELGPEFDLAASRIGGHDVVVVKGEIDMATAPTLDKALSKFSKKEVFLDLRKTEFMDSAGLKVLITQRSRIEESGGVMRLVVGEGPVMRLLELAGVREAFSIRPTIDSPDG